MLSSFDRLEPIPTDQYLGRWEDNVFTAAGDVEQYCLENYVNRTQCNDRCVMNPANPRIGSADLV